MTTQQPQAASAAAEDELPKLKTAAELLDGLGMPHTEAFLKVAQAAINDYTDHRAKVKKRVQKIADDFNHLEGNIQKLGADNIADLSRRFAENNLELAHTKDKLFNTQKALKTTIGKLPEYAQREMLRSEHGGAIRSAIRDLDKRAIEQRYAFRVSAPKKPSGPSMG